MIRRALDVYETKNAAAPQSGHDGVTGQPGRATAAAGEANYFRPMGATPLDADPLATVRPLDFTASDGSTDYFALCCWMLLPTREGK